MALSVLDTAHMALEILTAVMVFAGFIITLMIKNSQATVKADLIERQNELKDDFDAKHAENTAAIREHQAEDRAKFESIGRTLARIDGKLDRQDERWEEDKRREGS